MLQFVCAPILGNLSDRFGRRPVLIFAVGALGVDYCIMGTAPSLAWLFIGRAIAGIAGASYTPAYAYIADVSSPETRAQNFGLIGGLLGQLGPRAPFFAAAALSLLNFTYGVFVLPESLPRESRRPFRLARANPVGTLLQLRKVPLLLWMLAALFLWQVAHQVMPSTWAYYSMYRFGWTEAIAGTSPTLPHALSSACPPSPPRRRAAVSASYTMPSLIVYLMPPTRSGFLVSSFSRTAPLPYKT